MVQFVYSLRQQLEINFGRLLPLEQASLLSGMVLGSKKAIPKDFYRALKQTGTLHIVVASGMNVALLAGFLMPILALFFKRKIAVIPLVILIWFYAFLTGFEAPIIRASIMASLTFLAQEFGKQADPKRILIITAILMIFFKPALISEVSFQLSFISTAGLIFLCPVFKTSKNIFLRNENFSATLAAQIATLPIIVLNFGQYNFFSLVVNFLVLWTVPLVTSAGMIIGVLSLFAKPVAKLFAYLIYPVLKYFVIVIQTFSKIKILELWMPKISWLWGVGYYLFLGWFVWKRDKYPNQ